MSADLFWQAVAQTQSQWQQLAIHEVMQAINQLLHVHYPHLAAELQGGKVTAVYKLVITAHGATEHFEDLMKLTQAAPKLSMFPEIVAFRARTPMMEFGMKMDNFSLAPSDILVHHYAYGGRVGLQLSFSKAIPSDMQDHAKNMTFILLDHALGEYDFAIKIGPVEFIDGALDTPGVTLANFAPVFDRFWCEQLGHTALYPDGEHHWVAFRIVSQTDPDDKLLVQRNESAMALVGRADMLWRLEIEIALKNKSELDEVCEFEDQLDTLLRQNQLGIGSQISLQGNLRCMNWQVSDIAAATSMAEQLAGQFKHLELEIRSEFDPQWQDYLRWVS